MTRIFRFVRSARRFPMLSSVVFGALFLCACLTPQRCEAMGSGQKLPLVGFRAISVWNPDKAVRMDIAVWYPSHRAPRDIMLDGWYMRVAKDSSAVAGRFPVVLIAPDTASTRLASHDLASNLARYGFIVIAPTIPGDNVDDTSKSFAATSFILHPSSLKLAFEAVRQHAFFAPIMDIRRVGLLGVGAGAATALQLTGKAPDLSRLSTYCPEDESLDPLCSNWAKNRHAHMAKDYAALLKQGGLDRFTPSLAPQRAPRPVPQQAPRANVRGTQKPVPATPPTPPAPIQNTVETAPDPDALLLASLAPSLLKSYEAVPEILAVGFLTPGLIELFSDDALRSVRQPVGIFTVENDTVYPPERTATRLRELLPLRPASRAVQKATHFDLQAPCPPVYMDSFPALCGKQTSAGPDARKLRNEFFARFFQTTLGEPLPPPVKPEEDEEN